MEDLVNQLPQDIVIHHILPHIDYTSWVRATAVSRTWRDLFRQWPSPPDIPWLWLTDKQFDGTFLPSTSPALQPHPPKEPLHSGIALASYRQYLLMYDQPSKPHRSVYIYNPFTAVTYPLPPRPQLAGEDQQKPFFWGALTRPRSAGNTSTFLAVVIDSGGAILTCRLGDNEWTSFGYRFNFSVDLLDDSIVHGNWLYCVTMNKRIIVALSFDNELPLFLSPARPYTPVSRRLRDGQPDSIHYNLVMSCHNEVLLVTCYNFVDKRLKCPVFTVHKVLRTKKLVKVNNLGDQMLFLGKRCSRSTLHKSNLWPSDFFTKNSIYFPYLEDHGPRVWLGKFCLNAVDRSCSYAVFHHDQIPTRYRTVWITPVDQRKSNAIPA